eukprot:29469-Amorphochlora_amoeboformis.AAC.1
MSTFGGRMRIGVGSGSTVVFAIERLKQRVEKGDLKDVIYPEKTAFLFPEEYRVGRWTCYQTSQ